MLEKDKERNGKNKKLGNSDKCSQNFSTLFWLFLQVCATVALVDSKSMALYNTQPSWQPNLFNNNKGLNWLKKLMIPLESTGILQILGKLQKIC